MKIINFNSELERKIHLRQIRSMINYSERIGIPYSKLIEMNCENINLLEEAKRRAATLVPGEEDTNVIFNKLYPYPLKSEEDYWRYQNLDTQYLLQQCASLIGKAFADPATNILLDLDFFRNNLEQVYHVSLSNLSFKELVLKIPVNILCDTEFNALAALKDEESDTSFPHVNHYFMTYDCIRYIIALTPVY